MRRLREIFSGCRCRNEHSQSIREHVEKRKRERKVAALVVEESQWKQMAEAAARVMWPAVDES
jgi:hypothetical protein